MEDRKDEGGQFRSLTNWQAAFDLRSKRMYPKVQDISIIMRVALDVHTRDA